MLVKLCSKRCRAVASCNLTQWDQSNMKSNRLYLSSIWTSKQTFYWFKHFSSFMGTIYHHGPLKNPVFKDHTNLFNLKCLKIASASLLFLITSFQLKLLLATSRTKTETFLERYANNTGSKAGHAPQLGLWAQGCQSVLLAAWLDSNTRLLGASAPRWEMLFCVHDPTSFFQNPDKPGLSVYPGQRQSYLLSLILFLGSPSLHI